MDSWRETALEVTKATAPIAGMVVAAKLTLLEVDFESVAVVILGSLMALAGLVLFLIGARVAMLPFGERLGGALPAYGSVLLLIAFGALIGFAITVAEPNVRVMERQVNLASPGFFPEGSLVLAIVLGVAFFAGLGLLRTALRARLITFLIPSYIVLFILVFLAPPEYLAIAFDSGGAATGPLSVPFIIAFNVGVVMVLGRGGGVRDAFGVVALSSIGPVIAVLLLGVWLGGAG